MTAAKEIELAVLAVEDPEIPITLADLGVLRSVDVDTGFVRILLRPTRLGCPARGRMERDVVAAVARIDSRRVVDVQWEALPWTEAEVSSAGHAVLREFGYAAGGGTDPPECPYCRSTDVRGEGLFGGALCKVPWTCRGCGSTFDVLRSTIEPVAAVALSAPTARRPTGGAR